MLFFEHFFDTILEMIEQEIYMSDDILTMIAYITKAEFSIDRANILNKHSRLNVGIPANIDDISFDHNISYDYINLNEVCEEVSTYYINKANTENKKLGIFWSGGVDSTLIVCSFLQNIKLNLNSFYVLLTEDSILENEYFFTNCINNRCQYIKYSPNEYKQYINSIYRDFILVSGYNGDELFGNKFILYNPQLYGMNYSEVLPYIYILFLYNRNEEYANKLAEYHLPIYQQYFNDVFDFNIITVEEFVWALSFMCRWQWMRLDNILRCNNLDLLNHYYTFFSHKLFQQWALYNKKHGIHDNINPYIQTRYYKKDFKEYIYQYDKNTDYLNNKGKLSSLLEYTNDINGNEFVIYSNKGIRVCKVNKRKENFKYRDIYEVCKQLIPFYKLQ